MTKSIDLIHTPVGPVHSLLTKPAIGDYVLVLGQITSGQTHPDDLLVKFTSHNADVEVDVQKVSAIHVTAPDSVARCKALTRPYSSDDPIRGRLLVACEEHDGHHGSHHAEPDFVWTDSQVLGFMEDA